jgi:hypothetical protein
MKRSLLILTVLAALASCSSPKYTYNFDHYTNQARKDKASIANEVVSNHGLPAIQPELLTASSSNEVNLEMTLPIVETKSATAKRTYPQMTKAEQKTIRKHLKAEIKNSIRAKKTSVEHVGSTKAMDRDLKLAAIFGAVGIVALIISGQVFYIIGGIALLIGVVFFVKWLLRQ